MVSAGSHRNFLTTSGRVRSFYVLTPSSFQLSDFLPLNPGEAAPSDARRKAAPDFLLLTFMSTLAFTF